MKLLGLHFITEKKSKELRKRYGEKRTQFYFTGKRKLMLESTFQAMLSDLRLKKMHSREDRAARIMSQAFRTAADDNKVFNVLSGTPIAGFGPIKVAIIKRKPSACLKIFVGIKNAPAAKAAVELKSDIVPVLRVDIDFSKEGEEFCIYTYNPKRSTALGRNNAGKALTLSALYIKNYVPKFLWKKPGNPT